VINPPTPRTTHNCRDSWRPLCTVAALSALPAASFYLITALIPAYLSELTLISSHLVFTLHTVNLAVLVGAMPLGGWLADGAGQRRLLLLVGCSGAVAALAYPIWLLLARGLPAAAWAGQLLLVLLCGVFAGAVVESEVMALPKGVSFLGGWGSRVRGLVCLLGVRFHSSSNRLPTPTQMRATGLGIACATAAALVGGAGPLIAVALVGKTADRAAPAYVLVATAAVSCVASWAASGRPRS